MSSHTANGAERGKAIQRALPSTNTPSASAVKVIAKASDAPAKMCSRRRRPRSRSTNSSGVMAPVDS